MDCYNCLLDSVRYKDWNDVLILLSNLITEQASFERKTQYYYARTRDAAIKCLVMFDVFKDAICVPRNEFFPEYSVTQVALVEVPFILMAD